VFNVGGPEIIVILLVALLVLGPEQLPKAMRTFGTVMGEVRKVSNGFQNEMRSVMDTMDVTGSESTSPATKAPADKPHSATPPSGAPGEAGAESDAAAIDDAAPEVVARNSVPAETDPAPRSSNGSGRPQVDPADRAAG
jgi:sec-independent protein translocase protein TatB